MPSDKRPPIFLYAKFDVQALCRTASSLRQDIACTCNPDQHPASGSFNWAVFLTFEDGVQWVLRSPHTNGAELSMELSSKLLESEAATMKYVQQNSDIPVPTVHLYRANAENEIGIPFILMSKASGWPLEKAWKNPESDKPVLAASLKAKVLRQLGETTYKLSQLRFSRIGSLFERDGLVPVEECLSRGHILHDRYSLEGVARGPFISEEHYIEPTCKHAEVLQLSHHCFTAPIPSREDYESHDQYLEACDLWNDFVTVGKKLDSSDNRLDYIVAAHALRELIPAWRSQLPNTDSHLFPLCHADLSVNNIYVDDDFNITCIIDWAFSTTVPEALLLTPPGLPQSRYELDKSLRLAFQDGFETAIIGDTCDQRTESIKAALELVKEGRCSWLLTRFLNFDSIDDHGLFTALWEHTYGHSKDIGSYFAERRSSPSYIELYNDVRLEDQPLEKLKKAESNYFRDDWGCQYTPFHQQRLRKTGELFVTDSKLWKWILEFKKDWGNIS
ncbi:hypothetical protein BO83DRAFT_406829 [Aspergillus eucalypticola CBS 122712]|uniref:Uncharacterized protein n=1 Tax=Aspergillus eucalypticola (strain CBS 122712 / IBT 29274) TaxID=1448314 RepID=A0A317VVC5_ASPEC|nr:uncharacterized protein BO83DRAFT_406829 [Aspergillus eucalypticola CBS 122712]PWY77745.1 hypothetical protein BO83DRAFT_406829 [Aspergillus eucalypticola CBS 122712]